jgi:hypothetical protein
MTVNGVTHGFYQFKPPGIAEPEFFEDAKRKK